MEILLSDNEILDKINNYPNHNWIWIEIWEMSEYEIQIVVTVNKEEMCHLGEHKTLHVCLVEADVAEDIAKLKSHGKSLARKIRRKFPNSEVRSKLYYKQ
jgi:hypothetical protein